MDGGERCRGVLYVEKGRLKEFPLYQALPECIGGGEEKKDLKSYQPLAHESARKVGSTIKK